VPFTLSHAAAALPFRRTRLPLSALLIGCFAPDFEYFILLRPHGPHGHIPWVVFYIEFPLSFAALWLFHKFMKEPLEVFLPRGFRRRIHARNSEFSFLPLGRLALILFSILVGIATHLVWDSFTHTYYWPYKHWSFLHQPIDSQFLGTVEMFQYLQFVSSVVGLIIVAIWIAYWYWTTKPVDGPMPEAFTPVQKRMMLIFLPLLAAVGGVIRAYHGVGQLRNTEHPVRFAGEAGLSFISLLLIEILLCGVLVSMRRLRRKDATE
jgi:hypothetical protein